MRYLSQRYFKFAPKLHYDVRPRDVRSFGDLLWYSYDFWIDTPEEHRTGHGMSMCRGPVAHPQHAQFGQGSGQCP